MTERELVYVTTIAQEGSLTKAAEKLFVAQPSLTLFLQRLEQTLGAKLFHRTPVGLELTAQGEQYVAMAYEIQKLYGDMTFEMGGISQMYHGKLRLGTTVHLGTMVLPYLLSRYTQQFPNIEVELVEANSTQLESLLAYGQIDIALMHRPVEGKQVALETVATDPFLLAVSPQCPWAVAAEGEPPVATAKMLADMPLIMVSQQQRIGQVTTHILELAQVQPQVRYVTRNFDTARSMAAMGLGATFVPASYTRYFPSVHELFYFSLPPQWQGAWELCIAYPRKGRPLRPCVEMAELVRQYVAENRGMFA